MYTILSSAEKVFRGLRIILKLSYYKLKYGSRIKIGKKVHFRKGFIINISKNGKLEIGDGTFFNNYCSINCHEKIKIGNDNLFGEGVRIYDHNHIFNRKDVNVKKDYNCHPVVIGDRNWFGSNVIILNKAEIGDDNVFGGGIIINAKYGSGYLVKRDDRVEIKLIYREDGERDKN